MNMGGGQDWDQVVIRKKKPTNSQVSPGPHNPSNPPLVVAALVAKAPELSLSCS